MAKNKMTAKGTMDRKEVIEYANRLLSNLGKGKVYLKKGKKTLILDAGNKVKIGIKTFQKKDRGQILLDMIWERSAKYKKKPINCSVSSKPSKPAAKKVAKKKKPAAKKRTSTSKRTSSRKTTSSRSRAKTRRK